MTTEVIDVHTHTYPRLYLDCLAERSDSPRVDRRTDGDYFVIFPGEEGRLVTEDWWSLDAKLAFMDAHGINRSVVSLGNPWLDPFTGAESVELAAELNMELASFEKRSGGRIVAMGCLPEGSVGDALDAIRTIQSMDGLYGVISGTRLCGRAFDDLELEPIWAALSESRLPLLVHPHHGIGLSNMEGFGHALQLALAFTFETTTALSRLAMSGVLDRHPDLCVIGSHGGGTLPYLAGRLDGCWAPDEVARQRRNVAPTSAFRKLFLDALVYHPRALRAAADLVGTERMMFGTDHPFAIANPTANMEAIGGTFSTLQADQVLFGTARALFGLTDHGGDAL